MALLLISLILLVASCWGGRRIATAIGEMPWAEGMFWARDAVCVTLASVLTCLAMETWNAQMQQVAFMYIQHEFFIVLTIMSICYLVAFRSGVLMAVASAVGAFVGLAEHYLWKFRGTPVIPTDLSPSSFGTAGEVAGGYDFAPDEVIFTTVAFALLAIAVSMLIRRPKGHAGVHLVRDSVERIREAFVTADGAHEGSGQHFAPMSAEGDPGRGQATWEPPQNVTQAIAGDMPSEMDEPIETLPDDSDDDGTSEPGLVAIQDEIGIIESEPDSKDVVMHEQARHDAKTRLGQHPKRRGRSPRHFRNEDDLPDNRQQALGRVTSLISPLLTLIIAISLVTSGSFLWSFDYEEGFPSMVVDWWQITKSYREQGTIPTFSFIFQTTRVAEPDGWSEERAQAEYDELVTAYAPMGENDGSARETPTGSSMPDIIGIMNESHCDMTIYDRLELPVEAAPQFMRTDAPEGIVESGRTRVSVFGGQTANSEYEFLTGDSLIALGMSTVPFAQYNLSESPSLPRQLAEMGYGTYAIHPCDPRNWDRNLRYPELGFDEFRCEDDFHEMGLDDSFHDTISDRMCYAMAKQILDARESSGQPTFIWDVTVQNHGGYDKNDLPEESVVDYDLSMLSEELEAQVREYMSCAEESNKATIDFLAELEERDRPTIVLFYGDHQPVCNSMVMDALYSDLDSNSVGCLKYQTDYFIWENKAMRADREDANKVQKTDDSERSDQDSNRDSAQEPTQEEVIGDEEPEETIRAEQTEPEEVTVPVDYRFREEIGVNMLGARLMERIGYPLTDFQKAVLSLRSEARSTCLMGMMQTTDCKWLIMDDKEPPEPLRKLRDIDWLVTDRKVAFS